MKLTRSNAWNTENETWTSESPMKPTPISRITRRVWALIPPRETTASAIKSGGTAIVTRESRTLE